METVYISPVEVRVKFKRQYNVMWDNIRGIHFYQRKNPTVMFKGEPKVFPMEYVAFCIMPQASPLEELALINSMINSEECEWMRFRNLEFKGGYGGFGIKNPFSNFSL